MILKLQLLAWVYMEIQMIKIIIKMKMNKIIINNLLLKSIKMKKRENISNKIKKFKMMQKHKLRNNRRKRKYQLLQF